MITIRSGRLEPETGTGPQTMTDTFYFDREIRSCWVVLTGYKLGYEDSDHHLQTISVDLSAEARDTEFGRGVVVEATLLLRDKNGDDTFSGWAEYLLFVDLGLRVTLVDGGAAGLEPVVEG